MEAKLPEIKGNHDERTETKKESKFGKDKYGRPFQFDESSIPKLMNREQKRAALRMQRKQK